MPLLILAGLIGAGIGTLVGVLIGAGLQRNARQWEAERAQVEREAKNKAIADRDEARKQRDRLNERNSTLAGELEEAGRANGELQVRIRGWEQTERNYLNRIAQLDAALKLAQAKASGEGSEHDTQPDTTPAPEPEIEYEVKQPEQEYVALPQNGKKPASKKPASKKRNTGRVSV